MYTPEIIEDKDTLLRVLNDFKIDIETLQDEIYQLKNPDKVGLPPRPPEEVERSPE